MRLYSMKQKALDLLDKSIPDNIEKYKSDEAWVEKFFISNDMYKYYFDTEIDVPDYNLELGGPESDFHNAKIVFEAYKDVLNPVQASDLRLWAYLAHVQHWDYMYSRWRIDYPDEEEQEEPDDGKKTPEEKAIDRVGARYFFKASKGKAFVRQGIARLFWSAYLTYDEENENPYEFTEYFFKKQDIFTSITERSYARNKVFVLAAIKELKKHPDMSRADIRLFLAKLNQAGAITLLDSLSKEEAENYCRDIMNEISLIKCLEEGSRFIAVDNITGRSYGAELSIINGIVMAAGKSIITKPKSLVGKREGVKIQISGRQYVIKNIH